MSTNENPFGDPNDVNPFADPSITKATGASAQEFNPFENQTSQTAKPTYTTIPATIEPTKSEPPPAYTPQPFSGGYAGQDETIKRQEELERKAAELEQKEKELQRRQATVDKQNNFPPLPKFCCVQPCFYHDITVDIPMESQRTCRMVFFIWQLYVFALIFNLLTALALVCTGGESGATTFGVSLLYMVLFAPLSFVFWYRPLYKALKNDSSFNYMIFFFMYFFQIIFVIVYALGIPALGTCGWINAVKELSDNKAVAAMMFVCASLWTLLAIFDILLLRKLHQAYRRSGASMEKAQGEFAHGVATNKNVQNAAAEAVKAGVSGGGGSNTRY